MINLTPPEIKEQIKYGRYNVLILRYLVGLAVVTAVVAGIIYLGLILTGNRKTDLQVKLTVSTTEFAEYQDTLVEAETLSDTITTIKALLDREFKFSEVLDKIADLIPKGATLDSISLSNEDEGLQLSTTIESQELAAVFQKNLSESDLFTNVDIISVTANTRNSYTAVFRVVFTPDESPITTTEEAQP